MHKTSTDSRHSKTQSKVFFDFVTSPPMFRSVIFTSRLLEHDLEHRLMAEASPPDPSYLHALVRSRQQYKQRYKNAVRKNLERTNAAH